MSVFRKESGGPIRAYQNAVECVIARVTGGGGGASMTLTLGGRGITTITNRGPGQYRINFDQVPAGQWLGMAYTCHGTADTVADHHTIAEVRGSYSSANKLVDFTVSNLDATPALEDLATTEGLTLFLYWTASAVE